MQAAALEAQNDDVIIDALMCIEFPEFSVSLILKDRAVGVSASVEHHVYTFVSSQTETSVGSEAAPLDGPDVCTEVDARHSSGIMVEVNQVQGLVVTTVGTPVRLHLIHCHFSDSVFGDNRVILKCEFEGLPTGVVGHVDVVDLKARGTVFPPNACKEHLLAEPYGILQSLCYNHQEKM